jgi:hypothetical protein
MDERSNSVLMSWIANTKVARHGEGIYAALSRQDRSAGGILVEGRNFLAEEIMPTTYVNDVLGGHLAIEPVLDHELWIISD